MTRNKIFLVLMLCIATALMLSACQAGVNAQVAEEPAPIEPTLAPEYPSNILFVGDGLLARDGGLDVHLEGLVNESEIVPDLETIAVGKNHTFLDKMWGYASEDFESGNFDVVILTTSLDEFWDDGAGREEFFDTVSQIDEEVRAKGSKTVLIMNWAFAGRGGMTQEDVVEVYSQIGEELGIVIVPAGMAFEIAMAERPDYDLFERNGIVPNSRGTYLITLLLYATIYQENPEGFEYQLGNIYAEIESLAYKAEKMHMSEDELSFLQRIAWETVISYAPSGVSD